MMARWPSKLPFGSGFVRLARLGPAAKQVWFDGQRTLAECGSGKLAEHVSIGAIPNPHGPKLTTCGHQPKDAVTCDSFSEFRD